MKKPKVEFGQCYECRDHVYMILRPSYDKFWVVQDTLTKKEFTWAESFIVTLPRPFPNWG